MNEGNEGNEREHVFIKESCQHNRRNTVKNPSKRFNGQDSSEFRRNRTAK